MLFRSGIAGRTLTWVDRKGMAQAVKIPPRAFFNPRLSPDGRYLAVGVIDTNIDIWVSELARGAFTRLTFDPARDADPVWTPDGKRIAFGSERAGPENLYWKPADSSGAEERLTTSPNAQRPESFSPDGKWLAYQELTAANSNDIWVLPGPGGAPGERKPRPFLQTPFNEHAPRFSPDGRWIAYCSDESRRLEVYVQPFPGPGGKWQVSTDGGAEPVWARSGRELFYRNGDKMMTVDVSTAKTFSAGTPRVLFEGAYFTFPGFTNYDVSADGQRFVMIRTFDSESAPSQLHLVQNFTEELKRRR